MNTTTTITQKGQVTIPAQIRKALGLNPSDSLLFTLEEEKIIATPIKKTLLDLYGSVKSKGRKPIDLKKLRLKMVKAVAQKVANEGL